MAFYSHDLLKLFSPTNESQAQCAFPQNLSTDHWLRFQVMRFLCISNEMVCELSKIFDVLLIQWNSDIAFAKCKYFAAFGYQLSIARPIRLQRIHKIECWMILRMKKKSLAHSNSSSMCYNSHGGQKWSNFQSLHAYTFEIHAALEEKQRENMQNFVSPVAINYILLSLLHYLDDCEFDSWALVSKCDSNFL